MPAITSVVIADAVPSNKTLYPLSASIASSKYRARDGAIQAGNRSLELKMSLASAQRPTDRVTILYGMPVEETVDGVIVVRDILRFTGEFVLPTTVGATIANNFWTEVKNLVGLGVIQSYVRDRDPNY